MLRQSFFYLTFIFSILFSHNTVAQIYDISVANMQFPDTVTLNQTGLLQGYIKNNGPGTFNGIIGMGILIPDTVPIISKSLIPSVTYGTPITTLAPGDSVYYDKNVFIDPDFFTPGQWNIVIVWPTGIQLDIDSTNNHFVDSTYVLDTVNPPDTTGIDKMVNERSLFQVYSDLSSSYIGILVNTNEAGTISILDIQGRSIKIFQIPKGSANQLLTFDISGNNISPGIYLVTYQNRFLRGVKKLTIF